jgi:hypothetical protein
MALFRALLLGFAGTAYAYTDEALADQIVDLPGCAGGVIQPVRRLPDGR